MPSCSKCQGSMSIGFIVTEKSGTNAVSNWSKGAPDKRWWGIKLGKKAQYEIQTWRCGRCGFLESYAK